MKIEDYVMEWTDKVYGCGSKELGDWTTDEVMRFAKDFARAQIEKDRERVKKHARVAKHSWGGYTHSVDLKSIDETPIELD